MTFRVVLTRHEDDVMTSTFVIDVVQWAHCGGRGAQQVVPGEKGVAGVALVDDEQVVGGRNEMVYVRLGVWTVEVHTFARMQRRMRKCEEIT